MSYFVGIDIGSTCAKTIVLNEDLQICHRILLPTGWSSVETAQSILEQLQQAGFADSMKCVATGYGRISVDYASKVVTEITCHGRGAYHLLGRNCMVVDIGGQDTKVITVEKAVATNFLMNDKCAAGTGKFLEIMANRLNVTLEEMFDMASQGKPLAISSMCTVFAESEVISHIGAGESREDIAAGVVESVVNRAAGLCSRYGVRGDVMLTGGLSESAYLIGRLSERIGVPIHSHPMGRFAGALGAALIARDGKKVK